MDPNPGQEGAKEERRDADRARRRSEDRSYDEAPLDASYEEDLDELRSEFGYDPETGDMNDSQYEPYDAEDFGEGSEDALVADNPFLSLEETDGSGSDVEGVMEKAADMKSTHGGEFKRQYGKDIGIAEKIVDHVTDADGAEKAIIDGIIRLFFEYPSELYNFANPLSYYNTSGGGAYSLEELYMINEAAKATGVPREVIATIGMIETVNVGGLSPVGAAGPFQHMDTTARPAGEVVGYRQGEVESAQNDEGYVIHRDGVDVTIGRYGDYEDVDQRGRYYPFEDARYGTEGVFGTGIILGGKFNYKDVSTWFEAALKYNGGPGYSVPDALRSASSGGYAALIKYILSGPYPETNAWGYKAAKTMIGEGKEAERRIALQEASKESRKYALKFAFAMAGASKIDWSAIESYQPKYQEVHVPEGGEPISLADLTKGGYGVDKLYQNGWNREYQFLRVPFPSDMDIYLPESGEKYNELRGVYLENFLNGDSGTGYAGQIDKQDGLKRRSGIITAGTFKQPHSDASFALYDEEKGTLLIPHTDRHTRGGNPPTLADLAMCVDPLKLIEANPHYFGGRDKNGVYHTPHPDWQNHMENTFLRPGSYYQMDRENAGVFEAKLRELANPETGEKKIEAITDDEQITLRRADFSFEEFVSEGLLETRSVSAIQGNFVEILSQYSAVDKPWHTDYVMPRWHMGHIAQTDNPLQELISTTKQKLDRDNNNNTSFYETVKEDAFLMLRWLDEFFYPHTLRVLEHRRDLTPHEIKFLVAVAELYTMIAIDNEFILPERFWEQYKTIKDAYFEVQFYELEKFEKYETIATDDSMTPLERYRMTTEKLGRSREDWDEVVDLLRSRRDMEKEMERAELMRYRQHAEEKIRKEMEKFERYGLYSGVAEIIDDVYEGVEVVRVPIYIEGTDYKIAYAEFNGIYDPKKPKDFHWSEKFHLYYMSNKGPNTDYISTPTYEEFVDNTDIESIEFEHMLDPLFSHVVWEILGERKVLENAGRNQYRMFVHPKKYHTISVNPKDGEIRNRDGTLSADNQIGEYYIDFLDANGGLDGDFITVARSTKGEDGDELHQVVHRFHKVSDLIDFFTNSTELITHPSGG